MGRFRRYKPGEFGLFIRLAALMLPVLLMAIVLSEQVLAKTYTITDGDRVVTYTGFASDPGEILHALDMELQELDSYTATDSAITVHRGLQVRVSYRGELLNLYSSGETVGQLLDRLGLTIGEEDVLSHGLDLPVYDGMELQIDRVVTRRETYATTIPYETTYCNAPSIPAGSDAVLTRGRDGELLCTADVTYRNGIEQERKVLSEDVTIAAVAQVIGVGTGEAIDGSVDPNAKPIIGDGYIRLPTGEILTYTKTDTVRATGYTHTDAGCDMITATGTTVRRGTVAVDPRFIPYGTRMFIVSNDGEVVYGIAVAEDCGGAIKRDRMDLYFPTYEECIQFGYRRCTLYFLG